MTIKIHRIVSNRIIITPHISIICTVSHQPIFIVVVYIIIYLVILMKVRKLRHNTLDTK